LADSLRGELPSQDGDYWIFYQEDDLYITNLYCFFAPPSHH
jgi:hypothetical protein